MRPPHKTVERQIRKLLDPEIASRPDMAAFFQAISEAYYGFDEDRALIERSLELSSKELTDACHKIEEKVVERTQQLNDEHSRLISAINSLDVGLLMTFKDGQTITYNSSLLKILSTPGAPTDTAQDSPQVLLDVIDGKLASSGFRLVKEVDKCQQTGTSFQMKELPYNSHILSIFGAAVKNQSNDIIGSVVLIEDITEAKLIERSKDEFFSIASHELRTPLTSIRGNSSMMISYYQDILGDSQLKEMIDDIHTSSVRLIEIVNDFLDTSRLEQGKMNFSYEAVNIESVIESIVYEMKGTINSKGIYLNLDKLTLDQLPKVYADKNRLKQVIYNLIGNSAKFTDHGGITISSKILDDFIEISVSDTGRGMTRESQQLLFRKFQQAGSSLITRDNTHGTGLGLYISKMIVESMGGKISLVSSIEGQGTTFSFTLPVYKPGIKSPNDNALPTVTDAVTGLTTSADTKNEIEHPYN